MFISSMEWLKKKKISFIILSFSLMTLVFFLELIAKFIYLIPRKIILHPEINFKVFNTKIGRIGLFICYDAFFPEAARSLAIQGVDLLVNSTNWEKPYDYDIAKQMKHDYYTMLTERRPDVYIA